MVPSMGRAPATRDYGGVSASERKTERRRKLLDAGRRIWGTSGVTEISVRGVCAEARLGPRYFYEQFPDRDALVLAVVDELRDELFGVLLQTGLNEPGDAEAKLRAALTSLFDIIVDDPVVHRIFTDVLVGAGGLAEPRRQAFEIVTNLVLEHGPGLLDFEPPSPTEMRRAATFIAGGVTQVVDSWVHDPQESPTALAGACADLALSVVRGLAKPRRTPAAKVLAPRDH